MEVIRVHNYSSSRKKLLHIYQNERKSKKEQKTQLNITQPNHIKKDNSNTNYIYNGMLAMKLIINVITVIITAGNEVLE